MLSWPRYSRLPLTVQSGLALTIQPSDSLELRQRFQGRNWTEAIVTNSFKR